ncbi:MAG: flagellar protein FlaG [Gammaproteobacteria bacterium]|nr:flagellar protein FlaG [Gammaproteobacteria bacterium]
MSVDSLLAKDSRVADMVLERNIAVKSVQAEPTPRQQQTDNTDKLSIAEQVEKTAAEQAEKAVSAVSFDNNQIRQTLEQINKVIPIANTRLVFEFDELGDPPVIKVIDKTSNELIREIPSQDLVKVAKAFSEMADNLTKAGALINFQA